MGPVQITTSVTDTPQARLEAQHPDSSLLRNQTASPILAAFSMLPNVLRNNISASHCADGALQTTLDILFSFNLHNTLQISTSIFQRKAEWSHSLLRAMQPSSGRVSTGISEPVPSQPASLQSRYYPFPVPVYSQPITQDLPRRSLEN